MLADRVRRWPSIDTALCRCFDIFKILYILLLHNILMSSDSSHHPHEHRMAQFSLHVHKNSL